MYLAMNNYSPAPERVQRLLSLDVLRGITIAFMIMVNNNGGSGSWGFMNHAEWNGLTPTDLVFPTFVFVVGASIVYAFEARLARGSTRAQLAWHTLQRAAILFLLGIVVNGFPFFALAHLRIYGVLQRIALCYLLVGLFYLWDQRVGDQSRGARGGAGRLLDSASLGSRARRRNAGPGDSLHGSKPEPGFLDRPLHHAPPSLSGSAGAYNLRDPEGLLSTLPALGTTLLGVLTGLWLRARKPPAAKTLGLAAGALACLASGYLWSIWFPLNKNMWTSSYVLVAAGWSLAVLTLVFWAADLCGWRKRWTWPWLVLGSNAIAAYMFSELVPSALYNIHFTAGGRRTNVLAWVFNHVFARIPSPGWAAFAYSVSMLAVFFIPVWALYRKRIYIKV